MIEKHLCFTYYIRLWKHSRLSDFSIFFSKILFISNKFVRSILADPLYLKILMLILHLPQHMRRCQMTRGGESTTSLGIMCQDRTSEEEPVEATRTTILNGTSSPLTLMTCSKTLTPLVTNNFTTTFTPIPRLTKSGTLTATSRRTRRPWTSTSGRLGEDFLTICLRTWRRCFPLTHTALGLRAASRAQASSTAGQWPNAGATWWPPSLTAPECEQIWTTAASGGHSGLCWVKFKFTNLNSNLWHDRFERKNVLNVFVMYFMS